MQKEKLLFPIATFLNLLYPVCVSVTVGIAPDTMRRSVGELEERRMLLQRRQHHSDEVSSYVVQASYV